MAVPYTFGTATSSIPLSQLDSNFATVITLGNTAIQLGNTVTTLNNMTLANVTISSGNVTITNVAITTANVTTANITTAVIGTETVTTSTITTANVTTANITTGNITNGTVITSLTLSYGTANGVTYLNGSKVLTSGSELTFDGTNLALPNANSATAVYATFNTRSRFGYDGLNVLISDAGTNKDIVFSLNTAEQMRLTTTGLGIGINSPATKLNIGTGGVLRLNRTDNVQYSEISCAGSGVGTKLVDSNGDGFRFFNTATQVMTIDASGNVGTGVTNPSSYGKLATVATAASTAFYAGSSTQGVYISNSTGNDVVYNSSGSNAGAHVWQTGNVERARIAQDGIVTMSAYGAGAATFSAAGVISSVSDETWKIKDGVPVDPDSMLKKLEPGYWYYNDEKKETFGVDRQLGFYAQNVNAAIGPEAAPTPEEGKPWGYYDRSVLAVTVMSLQKALATIESLTARIEALESKEIL